MAVVFDEITADVEPSAAPPAITAPGSTTNSSQIDPQDLAAMLALQAERAARLYAD